MKAGARMLAILASLAAAVAMAAPAKPQRPIPAVEHVVLISIDGLRPDLALRANMPVLRRMLSEGSYTFWAKTTEVSVTLPSHTSMVTGVTPEKHGVTWNDDLAPGRKIYPKYPTVMEMASRAGYVTAMVAGKSKFVTLAKPGTLTYSFMPDREPGIVPNAVVLRHVQDVIQANKPDLLFIHFADVDSAGHESGWGSPQQIAAVEKTDAALGGVFNALERANMLQSTVVILSADHGGAGLNHGPDDTRSRHIPWIIVGPGVRRGYDLTRVETLTIRTEDSAATILYLLGLPLPSYLQGRPVTSALITGRKRH
jgi:predicted AlkP superfamily pyrophosphatase or phosphodiesterase